MLPEALQIARAHLCFKRPYLSTAIYALTVIPSNSIKTMAVDKYWRLYYEPSVLTKWTIEETSTVLYHEILHLLRNHPERLENYESQLLSNLAADMEINDDILYEGLTFPGNPVLPETFGYQAKLAAEEYYELLLKEKGVAKKITNLDVCAGKCGSCSNGQKQDWELGTPGPKEQGVARMQGELIRLNTAKQIKHDLFTPDHLKVWAKNKLSHTKVDWRKELASSMRIAVATTVGAVDYSYAIPSRRKGLPVAGELIFPAMVKKIPEVAIVVDTSGSMSPDALEQALSEISNVIQSFGRKHGVTLLSVDNAVNSVNKVFSADKVQLFGGGGTNMSLGIQTAVELNPKPHIIIVLTDGYTDWPPAPPIKTIIGLITDTENTEPETPDWAKTIVIPIPSNEQVLR